MLFYCKTECLLLFATPVVFYPEFKCRVYLEFNIDKGILHIDYTVVERPFEQLESIEATGFKTEYRVLLFTNFCTCRGNNIRNLERAGYGLCIPDSNRAKGIESMFD